MSMDMMTAVKLQWHLLPCRFFSRRRDTRAVRGAVLRPAERYEHHH